MWGAVGAEANPKADAVAYMEKWRMMDDQRNPYRRSRKRKRKKTGNYVK